jgi:hypothetical protein
VSLEVATKESGHQFDKRNNAIHKLNIVAVEVQTLSDIAPGLSEGIKTNALEKR